MGVGLCAEGLRGRPQHGWVGIIDRHEDRDQRRCLPLPLPLLCKLRFSRTLPAVQPVILPQTPVAYLFHAPSQRIPHAVQSDIRPHAFRQSAHTLILSPLSPSFYHVSSRLAMEGKRGNGGRVRGERLLFQEAPFPGVLPPT